MLLGDNLSGIVFKVALHVDSNYGLREFYIDLNWKNNSIDLYHAAAILSPRGTKSFVFARPASHWMRGWTGKIFCFSIA